MEKTLKLNSNDEAVALYGSLDENLRFAEKEFHVRISARNFRLKIVGDKENVEKAHAFFHAKLEELRRLHLKVQAPQQAPAADKEAPSSGKKSEPITFFHKGRIITGQTKNQQKYLEAIREKDVVIAIGPAGTGKTYLAMAAAIDYLKKKMIQRIVLTRPAVEAGESLGFLPGDFQAKVNPYLRPLYDALYDMLDYEEATRYIERGMVEVAPLAYMRGRTLNNCLVILDEAQNCTHAQVKMFLTRLGQHSKAIVNGDITQIDLPSGKKSGLVEIQTVLSGISGIRFVYFDRVDVVRHPLVQEIINAYEKYERKNS